MRTTSNRLSAVFADEVCLGSAWTPVTANDGKRETERAWCAYLNSTMGLVGFLSSRSKSLDYAKFSIAQLRALPTPCVSDLDCDPLVKAYASLSKQKLASFRDMADCPARTALDHAAADATGMDYAVIEDWRQRLAAEPTVSGRAWGTR